MSFDEPSVLIDRENVRGCG